MVDDVTGPPFKTDKIAPAMPPKAAAEAVELAAEPIEVPAESVEEEASSPSAVALAPCPPDVCSGVAGEDFVTVGNGAVAVG